MSAKQNTSVVYAVQGEKNSRKIRLDLFQNGMDYEIDQTSSVLISYKKPDGHGGMYDVLDNGESAFEFVDDSTNSVIITLAEQVLTTVGNVRLLVSFVLGDEILSTFNIILDVSENPGIDVAESEDYFSISVAIDAAKRVAEEIIQNETFASQEYVDDKVERLRVSIDEELEAVEDDSKTFYVTIEETQNGTFEANEPVDFVIGAYESGRTVKAIIEMDGENVSVPLIGIIEGNTAFYAGYGINGNYVMLSQSDIRITLFSKEIITQEHLDQLSAKDVSAIPVPTEAQVGQTIIVTEVDENGKPIKWSTANLGSGEGGSFGNAVLFIPQSLNDDQQEQARKNIGIDDLPTDGITPHIGDNGNWFIGDTDTGMPSRGADAPQEAVLYTPQPLTEAQKAQARENIGINALPSGGEWRLIHQLDIDETNQINSWTITQDLDGNPLELTKLLIRATTIGTAPGDGIITFNNENNFFWVFSMYNGTGRGALSVEMVGNLIQGIYSNDIAADTGRGTGITTYHKRLKNTKINSINWKNASSVKLEPGSSFTIYGC